MQQSGSQKTFWSVSLGHMAVDMFSGMAPVLLTFLSAHILSMSNTQIGFAVSAYQLTGALGQPVFGYLSDKSGGRLLGAGGVAWTVSLLLLSMVIAQTTGQYGLMLIPYVLAALGSGAFHPVGAMHAAESNPMRASRNTSMFFLAGQTGLAIGPTLAGFLLDRAATHNNAIFTQALGPVFHNALMERGTVSPILLLGLLPIPAVLLMGATLPSAAAHVAKRTQRAAETVANASASVSLPVKAIVLFALVVALRSLINPGAAAFIPRLFQSKGWDATAYGFVTSAFWIGGGLAGVYLGSLADKHDSRLLVAITLLLSAPALFLLTVIDGPLALALSLGVGALSGASHGLLVVQGQGLLPGRKGLASGAILGFMFATGALGSLLIGALSDRMGLGGAFQVVAAITVVTGLLGLLLPEDKRFSARAAKSQHETAAATGD